METAPAHRSGSNGAIQVVSGRTGETPSYLAGE